MSNLIEEPLITKLIYLLTYLFTYLHTYLLYLLTYFTYLLIYLLTYILTSLLTYLFTPSRRAVLEKLIGFQLVKKIPAFYGTRRFITALQ